MAIPDITADADALKKDISAGRATSATVKTLQTLLGLAPRPESQPGSSKATATRTAVQAAPTSRKVGRTAKTSKSTVKSSSKNAAVHVLEDASRTLETKPRHALATEVINISLKVLSSAAKSVPTNEETPQRPSRRPSEPDRALQVRSGNATPVKAAQVKTKAAHQTPVKESQRSPVTKGIDWTPTAECARLAFSHMRSVNAEKPSAKSLPKLQLEKGMLALAGQLVVLNLDSLAAKELYAIKKRLESLANQRALDVLAKTSEKDSLARLLRVDIDQESSPEVLSLLVTYHSHLLGIIANSRRPSIVEEALEHLQVNRKYSPCSTILARFRTDGDVTKAVRQLETLYYAILRLCPSVSVCADNTARDCAKIPQPLTVFRLQVLALSVRQEMWKIASHKIDIEKDLAEPFSRALSTLVRRMPATSGVGDAYNICDDALATLGIQSQGVLESSPAMFTIHRTLSTFAEKAGIDDLAHSHADQALRQCSNLGRSHARLVAAHVRRLGLNAMRKAEKAKVNSEMEAIHQYLLQTLSGSGSDYEMLLVELDRLLTKPVQETFVDNLDQLRSLARASGGFASRFAKSCPGKQSKTVVDLLVGALDSSKTNEDLVSWVSRDTVRVLVQSGALKVVSKEATTRPMRNAWSLNTTTLALSRAVKALLLKTLAFETGKNSSVAFDDEVLPNDDRGALFELQLRYALELAHKPKYRKQLSKFMPDLFGRLSQVYTSNVFPIRRTRIAAVALRVREETPDLLPSATLQLFKDAELFDQDRLENDQGLQIYALDAKTSVAVSRALHDGQVVDADLMLHLEAWQTLIEVAQDAKALEKSIDNPETLLSQLVAVNDYLGMLGQNDARLPVARMISQIELLWGADSSRWLDSLVRLASAYMALGYAEKAGEVLENAGKVVADQAAPTLGVLQYHIQRAEYFHAIDRIEDCRASVQAAARVREILQPGMIRHHQSKAYRVIHGRGWLLYSKCLLADGYPEGALVAAKRAVKVLNGIWSSLERQGHQTDSSPPTELSDLGERLDSPIDNLAKGIGKLNLRPSTDPHTASTKTQKRGAAYWPVVRLVCDALSHLSDVFMHHGIFNEANFACERALEIASGNGPCELTSRLQYHRSILLATAGKVEDAELCLARDQDESVKLSSLGRMEQFRAKASIAAKNGDTLEALRFLSQAETAVHDAQSDMRLSTLERISSQKEAPLQQNTKATKSTKIKDAPKTKKSSAAPKGILKKGRKAGVGAAETIEPSGVQQAIMTESFYMMRKLQAEFVYHKATVALRCGRNDQLDLTHFNELGETIPNAFGRCLVDYTIAMRKVVDALQADFSFNTLPESTLSFPALQLPERRLSMLIQFPSPAPKTAKSVKIAKSTATSKKHAAEESLGQLLLQAMQCVSAGKLRSRALPTYQGHMLYSMLSNASLLLSATSAAEAAKALHPVQEAKTIDMARILAAQCQLSAAKLEVDIQEASDLLKWPQLGLNQKHDTLPSGSFQREYIDILPRPWTAVSLSLTEACDGLYVVRYRSGESPLVLRLPFSRQRSEDANEEGFDFHAGKEELQEIIQLSDYSCHNSMDTKVKGAKTSWWSEREELDKKLQELLINMENMWFGGYKGIFSQHEYNDEKLAKFREAFDVVLGRQLPSRRTAKKNTSRLAIDDQVLQLFIGLGHDCDGEIDLDEALQDLLYFVVDILQFNGERNAYDEIDFDNMAIEILDALRDYHDEANPIPDDAHLILVLDRRLQAFPWENLPCLEGASVSRVDSMLTLRDRLVQMQQQRSNGCRYTVSRQSGTYILNPSGDLKSTESVLLPELEKLAKRENHNWIARVGNAPSEDEFKGALSTTSNVLYFGHGAGSQYIRPRAIKKLDKCSEVVWLMGCSSGAVTEYDELEPSAVPLAYMLAGKRKSPDEAADALEPDSSKCMAVLATLWDVTDKDIDRFSLAVGEEWGLWSPPQISTTLPAKTPRKHRTVAAPTTPDRSIKPPKTPKAKKTPAPARSPVRSRSRVGDIEKRERSLVEAVARSRDACYLRYLNGAAPVVYGVPVYLGD